MMPIPWCELSGNTLTIHGAQFVWVASDRRVPEPMMVSGTDFQNPLGWNPVHMDSINVVTAESLITDWYNWDAVIHPLPWGGNCQRWFTPESAGMNPDISWTPVPDTPVLGTYNDVRIVFPRCGYYVVYAFYCPQHHPRRSESSGFDFDCVADSNHDCSVTIEDLLLYLERFEAGLLSADIANGNVENEQPDGGVDINDLLWFLQNFVEGC